MGNQNSVVPDTDDSFDDEVEENTEKLLISSKTGRTENVGDTSVEIDIEALISELEAEGYSGGEAGANARKRLEQIFEERRMAHEMDEFDDVDDLDGFEDIDY